LVDFLAAAGQSVWQVLPLGPVGPGDSPYAGSSAVAGNPLLVSLEELRADGLDVGEPIGAVGAHTDYAHAAVEKGRALRRAFAGFARDPARVVELARFRAEQSWVDQYALFAALKERHGGLPWTSWPEPLARREPAALDAFRVEAAEEIALHAFVQLAFERQWAALKTYAAARGVRIMGDVPIFVAHDSADVWANRDLFHLDARGEPTVVAGVPPDYFSPTGQLWGNPTYRWEAMATDGYAWWVERIRRVFAQVDLVRIDHFRGFVAHWRVPAGELTAERGAWEPGPGRALFDALGAALGGQLSIVAEDLGTITPEVVDLLTELGFPGMKVLQFAFGDSGANAYLPHNYEPNAVVYTGTHDNDTTVGWFAALPEEVQHRVRHYLATDGVDVAWDLIRLALGSVADTAILPLQDLLALGSDARMNRPGQPEGNWTWRYHAEQLTPELAARLRQLTELYNRQPADRPPSG
jgi:4-alpha-glucanotransferase